MIGVVLAVCEKIISNYPTGGFAIMYNGMVSKLENSTEEQELIVHIVEWVELFACILLPVVCVGITSLLFYCGKLKKPIEVLQMGTEKIREHDLAFAIPKVSGDELGQVCAAFETMRAELVRTNQELWRQAEERRRLNAAFSHDLRNPLTVLKGTVKLLRQGKEDEYALERMETYVLRLEQYVEVMSSVQRLEQVPVQKKEVRLSTLRGEVEETVRMLAPGVGAEVHVNYEDSVSRDNGILATVEKERSVILDHGLFLTVAENLVGNAARYAKSRMDICLSVCAKKWPFLEMTVTDDGCGYPAKLLQDGPRPFGRMEEDAEHFGMGLYISRMLCMKHGGELLLENDSGGGARATAGFEMD